MGRVRGLDHWEGYSKRNLARSLKCTRYSAKHSWAELNSPRLFCSSSLGNQLAISTWAYRQTIKQALTQALTTLSYLADHSRTPAGLSGTEQSGVEQFAGRPPHVAHLRRQFKVGSGPPIPLNRYILWYNLVAQSIVTIVSDTCRFCWTQWVRNRVIITRRLSTSRLAPPWVRMQRSTS